jgi:hypothetical protein
MLSVATISKGDIQKQTKAAGDDFSVRKGLAGFRSFIETTDWEKGHSFNEGLDSLCLYLLVAACICLLAPIAVILMK